MIDDGFPPGEALAAHRHIAMRVHRMWRGGERDQL